MVVDGPVSGQALLLAGFKSSVVVYDWFDCCCSVLSYYRFMLWYGLLELVLMVLVRMYRSCDQVIVSVS